MNQDKWTRKSLESISGAQSLAREHGHASVTSAHIALVIFEDELGANILGKISQESRQGFLRNLKKVLVKQPSQTPAPAQIGLDQSALKVLQRAEDIQAKSDGDTMVAVDHVILALLDDYNIKQALDASGINRTQIEQAVKAVRGSRKVTGENAEETFDALLKYGQDLTERAAQSKLDPVIGRDDEIRRCIQVRWFFCFSVFFPALIVFLFRCSLAERKIIRC